MTHHHDGDGDTPTPPDPYFERHTNNVDPSYYRQAGMRECIDIQRELVGDARFADHCRLTAFGYRFRAGHKPGADVELETGKARWYEQMTRHIEEPGLEADPRTYAPGTLPDIPWPPPDWAPDMVMATEAEARMCNQLAEALVTWGLLCERLGWGHGLGGDPELVAMIDTMTEILCRDPDGRDDITDEEEG